MSAMDEIRQTFFQEAAELLDELESGLLALQDGAHDAETINAIFRAVHSIKGGAGMFELGRLVEFAHAFETVLDDVRNGKSALDGGLIALLLKSADLLVDLVASARDGTPFDTNHHRNLLAQLVAMAQGGAPGEPAPAAPAEAIEACQRTFRIRFAPHPGLYAKANEPALLFAELKRLGTVTIACDAADLPLLQDIDPEGSYLRWTIDLTGDTDEQAIGEVFEFVDGDCELIVESVGAAPAPVSAEAEEPDLDIAALIARLQTEIGEPGGLLTHAALAKEIPEPMPAARPEQVRTSPKDEDGRPAASAGAATIRVDLDRLDRLVNLVGELVINRAMVAQCVTEAGLAAATPVSVGLDELEQLTREIQDTVMALRAQPVKSVFQRMTRLVREVGEATGKSVQLVIEGEGTEVDKTIIERLTDPLTHMIRNAIDHGLESPERRAAAGKPSIGVVSLRARHASGHILIEVADDGAGLNRERVCDIAVTKGLIPADAQLTDDETDNLIFLPGFSTASTISSISGRGVGLDVVKRSVQLLGGRISIASRPGKGSTFTLSLPLTLAVLDGMVVGVTEQTLVVPLTAAVETLQLKSETLHGFGGAMQLANVRGTFVPVVDIARLLGYRDGPADLAASVGLLVESQNNVRAILLVDAIHGQRQVVIKSLEANYGPVVGIAAATILGDGRVALILDVDALVSEACSGPAPQTHLLQKAG